MMTNRSCGRGPHEGVEPVGEARGAFEEGVGEDGGVLAAAQDEVGEGDPAGGDEAPGPARDLQGGGLGVAGSEGVDHPVGGDAVGEEPGGEGDGVLVGGDGAVDGAAGVVGEPVGAEVGSRQGGGHDEASTGSVNPYLLSYMNQ